ncbi:MAG: dihydroorotase [Bacteroidia bacterium]
MSESYIIRNALFLQKGHANHNQRVDVLVQEGVVQEIGKGISSDAQELKGEEIVVSGGWIDMRCHLTDPGLEHKDTLGTLLDTAAAGGYTSLVTLPNSNPPISDKSSVSYLKSRSENHLVSVLPTGKLASEENNENLAELFDMFNAGAIAFTNGDEAVSNGLLKKALLYAKPFGAKIVTRPSDKSLENGGLVNESPDTIHTGLKTNPSLSESLSVREQIAVAEYCDAAIHLSCISTKESVALVREAKKNGVNVSCDAAIHNLCFTDKEVLSFDENFKVYPPLRSISDQQSLIEAINDGTIDAISSNHTSHNIESKQVEFDYADFGSLSLQLVLPWYEKFLADSISVERFVECVTFGPCNLLGVGASDIEVGNEANLTVFDRAQEWTFDRSTNFSLSKNSHEWKQVQRGRVVAVFNNKKVKIC